MESSIHWGVTGHLQPAPSGSHLVVSYWRPRHILGRTGIGQLAAHLHLTSSRSGTKNPSFALPNRCPNLNFHCAQTWRGSLSFQTWKVILVCQTWTETHVFQSGKGSHVCQISGDFLFCQHRPPVGRPAGRLIEWGHPGLPVGWGRRTSSVGCGTRWWSCSIWLILRQRLHRWWGGWGAGSWRGDEVTWCLYCMDFVLGL